MKFSGVTILYGSNFPFSYWFLNGPHKYSAACDIGPNRSVAKASNELLRAYRLVLGTRSGPALASYNRRCPTPDSAGRNGKKRTYKESCNGPGRSRRSPVVPAERSGLGPRRGISSCKSPADGGTPRRRLAAPGDRLMSVLTRRVPVDHQCTPSRRTKSASCQLPTAQRANRRPVRLQHFYVGQQCTTVHTHISGDKIRKMQWATLSLC